MIWACLIFLLLFCVVTLATPLTSNKPNWRIVGGNEAEPGAYPFMVSIHFHYLHSCGGAILGGVWVITAGFCVYGIAPILLNVLAGSNQHNSGGVTYQVKRTFVHPKYNYNTIVNDIALIQLQTPIVENNFIKRIALDTENTDKLRGVTLIGWGRTSYPGNPPDNLRYLKVKTISIEECKRAWNESIITDKQICTLTKVGEGLCQGDSGGPLVNDAGRLTGVISYGDLCAKGVPDIYTKVAAYVPWIYKKINK